MAANLGQGLRDIIVAQEYAKRGVHHMIIFSTLFTRLVVFPRTVLGEAAMSTQIFTL